MIDIIKESDSGLAVVQMPSGFHVVRIDYNHNQIQSVLPGDSPRDGGRWVASGTRSESAVNYVSSPRTRATAMRWFKKLTK